LPSAEEESSLQKIRKAFCFVGYWHEQIVKRVSGLVLQRASSSVAGSVSVGARLRERTVHGAERGWATASRTLPRAMAGLRRSCSAAARSISPATAVSGAAL